MSKIIGQPWIITLVITAAGWIWLLAGDRASTLEQVNAVEQEMAEIKSSYSQVNDRLSQLNTTLTRVRTDVAWIRDEMQRMRNQLEVRP